MSETRTYAVWRQDEGGNLFLVSDDWTSRDDAQAQADAMEAKGHKQTYFVKDSGAEGDDGGRLGTPRVEQDALPE